jgi:hypothetical protein
MDVGPQKAGPADSPIPKQAALNNFSCQNIFDGPSWPCIRNDPVSPQCSEFRAKTARDRVIFLWRLK